MLIRTQSGYVNLATISEAELHDDGDVTLHWGAHTKRYAGHDAAALHQVLEMLAGVAGVLSEPALPSPHDNGAEQDQTRAAEGRAAASPHTLKLHDQDGLFPSDSDHEPAPHTGGNLVEEAADGMEDVDGPAQPESALSRRADLVRKFEPIASLSHKQQGVFLAAIEKAGDFNHLAPKFRRMIQQAEARRREELRQ
jgi:hypothetical protein